MSTPAFDIDAFERARLRWEAPREIERLKARLDAHERAYRKKSQALRRELGEWEELAHPSDFREAIEAVAGGVYRLYWNLRDAGVTTFEDAEALPDPELLAIDGIGPVGLAAIRRAIEAHDSRMKDDP